MYYGFVIVCALAASEQTCDLRSATKVYEVPPTIDQFIQKAYPDVGMDFSSATGQPIGAYHSMTTCFKFSQEYMASMVNQGDVGITKNLKNYIFKVKCDSRKYIPQNEA